MSKPKIPIQQILFLVVLVIFVMSYQKKETKPYQTLHGKTMGTTYHLKFDYHESKDISKKINSVLQDVNQSMSTYIKDSEISRFNSMSSTNALTVTSDLWFMVSEALKVSKLSKGQYDVTVGPLLREYGFGPNKRVNSSPDITTINQIKKYVGYDKIKVLKNSQIQKLHPKVQLDLNSIAKGYGVDLICDILNEHSIKNYLVEVGGEIRVSGVSPRGDDWVIGINQPVRGSKADEFYSVIPIINESMATSGNYRSFVQSKDKILGHIIDPLSARPVQTEVLSATIFTKDCYYADALATMSMVSGLKRSIEILESLKVRYYLIAVNEDKTLQHYSNFSK
ncbi:MAG: FAD:protein FMN transferase [Candidatus Cloacimonetes bacterium]|nr:FAD:protein FMN transferase [Candidatus Cloacimonadota bacterium]